MDAGLLRNPVLALGGAAPTDQKLIQIAWEYLGTTKEFPPDVADRGKCIRTHFKYLIGDRLQELDRAMAFFLDNKALHTTWQFEHFLRLAGSIMSCDGGAHQRQEVLMTLKQIKVGELSQSGSDE